MIYVEGKIFIESPLASASNHFTCHCQHGVLLFVLPLALFTFRVNAIGSVLAPWKPINAFIKQAFRADLAFNHDAREILSRL